MRTKKQKRSRSFKKELIYSFVTISLISIILLGVFQIYQLSSLVDENQENQTQTTKFLKNYVTSYIDDYQKAIETRVPEIKENMQNDQYEQIQDKLRSIRQTYPGFVNLYVGDSDGQSVVFSPEVTEEGNVVENQDFSDRAYYQKLTEQKETVISSVFMGRGGTDQLLVTIATPLLNEQGDISGYILGALDLSALDQYITNHNLGTEGYAVVLDQDNNVVVHPNMGGRSQVVNLSDSPIVQHMNEQNKAAGGAYFTLDEGSGKEYITYETMEDLDGWRVWVARPASAISNTYVSAIITIILFILLTAVVMTGFSFILTERLEKSIRNLLEYIKEYTRGYKDRHFATRQIEGPSEMEELSRHFNHMIHEIENNRLELIQLNADLESRVQDRTTDLENKNLELKSVNKLITSVSTDKDIASFIQFCLTQIKSAIPYPVRILFQGYSITADDITIQPNRNQYVQEWKSQKDVYIEKINIVPGQVGYFIVEWDHKKTMNEGNKEFLQTFANSLSIMLQNKLLFERYRNKHAEFDAILESMSEGLMLLNNDRQVHYVNDFFQKEINWPNHSRQELWHMQDVYHCFMTTFNVKKQQLNHFFDNDEDYLKLEKELPAGKKKYYMLHKFLVMSEETKIGEGFLLRDITKEEEIDTLKTNLISLASHEFKTPITNIKGSVETLLRPEVEWDAAFQTELLEGVHEDIERIQHLVNDWMDISKIESGTMYVEPNHIRADDVIEASIDQIPESLREDAVITFSNQNEKSQYIYADKHRIQQVLINLLTNALRYNDEAKKVIRVTLQSEGEETVISVEDNGIGISNNHIEKIFNRFYQVDVTATRRTGGTGLGLSICQGIMEAHHGRMEVSSIPGEGSIFKLYFSERDGDSFETENLYSG
ncbi:sensor histidine kinase [Oceanobacillus timonensis]|uniref:sensor histidine kinase n=1 Tax=Oceanobacillus timonensis TaxID=1926285 RepID=UPI001FE2DA7F|nr:sensor histidine kinase [Oceanobacillus timonensis]